MVGFVQLSLFAACEPYSEERLSKARELGALLASKMAFDVTMRSGLIVDLDEDLPAKGDFAVQAFDSQISIDEAAVKERELDELPAVQLELPEAVDGKKGKRPFNLFFIDTRPLILKELEGLDAHIDDVDPALRDVAIAYREDNSLKVNCLVSKIIGQRWRNLTDQEQMVYKNRADYVNKKAQAKRKSFDKEQRDFYGSKAYAQKKKSLWKSKPKKPVPAALQYANQEGKAAVLREAPLTPRKMLTAAATKKFYALPDETRGVRALCSSQCGCCAAQGVHGLQLGQTVGLHR